LLDDTSLIAAMAYVALNPVRAGIAEPPEESDYTSAQQRILETQPAVVNGETTKLPDDLRADCGRADCGQPSLNARIVDSHRSKANGGFPYRLQGTGKIPSHFFQFSQALSTLLPIARSVPSKYAESGI